MPAVICDPKLKKTHRHAILTELRELQQIAMQDARDPDTLPAVRAQLMRAYVELQRQRNAERMRPTPKPVDVTQLKSTKRRSFSRAPGPVDPPTPQPVVVEQPKPEQPT